MASSDSEYVASSGDEAGAHVISKKGGTGKDGRGKQREKAKERWEEIQHRWEDIGDDNIESTVAELLEAGKKRRFVSSPLRPASKD